MLHRHLTTLPQPPYRSTGVFLALAALILALVGLHPAIANNSNNNNHNNQSQGAQSANSATPLSRNTVSRPQQHDQRNVDEALQQLGTNTAAGQSQGAGNARQEIRSRLQLSKNEFSVTGTIRGDQDAIVRAVSDGRGTVTVSHIHRGNLPPRSAGMFLAETLRGHNAIPSRRLEFSSVIHPSTRDDFFAGRPARASALGITGENALRDLGLNPKSFRFEQVRGKLNLVIDIG